MIDPKTINDAAVVVSAVLPQVMAAYSLFKIIWLATNPGKTEDDYETFLLEASQKNVDETDALLRAHGLEPDGQGGYRKKA